MRSRIWLRVGAAGLLLSPAALAAQLRPTHLGGGGDLQISLVRIIVSFVICVIIAALAILMLRQRSGKIDLAALFARIEPRARQIKVIETRRLSPHADISLVHQGGREYLLVLQAGSVEVLRDEPLPGEPREPPCV
jgi:hypothetical protein